MDFLKLEGKTIVVCGVANKRSVAWHCVRSLREAGAKVVIVVRSPERRESVSRLAPDAEIHVCDVESPEQIRSLADVVAERHPVIHGLIHSIAFANYSEGPRPFHETKREDFLQSVNVSCFSLIALANAFKDRFDADASVATISISSTRIAAENYGYMAPVKAALDSAVCFLAKSFSAFSRVRFNAVCASLLKTSASAGIPGYLNAYLYAEQLIPRKEALQTREVADVATFLMSPRSSGVNAQRLVVDAGMGINFFDADVVEKATKLDKK